VKPRWLRELYACLFITSSVQPLEIGDKIS